MLKPSTIGGLYYFNLTRILESTYYYSSSFSERKAEKWSNLPEVAHVINGRRGQYWFLGSLSTSKLDNATLSHNEEESQEDQSHILRNQLAVTLTHKTI